ncbi:MAG: hypothetical protein M3304_13255 [Actinomycetota bacterium]|nr:hypothetical protein [Actinomycetota bacterium]
MSAFGVSTGGDGDEVNYQEVQMRLAIALHRFGLTSDLMHGLGFGSIVAALSLWGRSAAVSNDNAKARAERLAIFVGLWPPTFFLLGKVLQDLEAPPEAQAARASGEDLAGALREEVGAS